MYKNLCVWVLEDWRMTKSSDEDTLIDTLHFAKSAGYDSIEIWIETMAQLVQKKSADYVKGLFSEAKIIPAGWQVNDAWRGSEEEYRRLLESLPLWIKTGQKLGCRRAFVWTPNFSDEMDFGENFRWHIKRLKPIADILRDSGIRFCLEWQGPRTLRTGHRYEFIHDMKGTLELIGEIDGKNMGLLLDSFHWYTSYGTVEDIRNLKGRSEVVYVHINDAPEDIPIDEQIDNKREIPGTTGVIDLVGFLTALKEIGYNGPVEPTAVGSKTLEKMPIEKAARTNSGALTKLFKTAGI